MLLGTVIGPVSTTVQAATKTDAQLTAIKKRGYMVLGVSADYPPYEFHKTINGEDKVVGFDIELARQVAKDIGVELRIKELGFDSLLGSLKTGKVDMIVSAMTPTPERMKEVAFSDSYLRVAQKVIVRKGEENKYRSVMDFKGQRVGVQKQTTQETTAKEEMSGAKVVSLKKVTDLILNLQQKKLNAVVVEAPVADAYVQTNQALTLANIKFTNADYDCAIALPKGSPAYLASVNRTIKKVKANGQFKKWRKTANDQMFSKQNFWQAYGSYFIKGTGITIILTIVGVLFGSLLGTLLALMKRAKNKLLKAIATVYIQYFRGTPLLVQVFMIYFGTQVIHLNVSAFVSAAIALSLNSGAYVFEVIRSGIQSVAKGQTEAARSLGLSNKKTMRLVILPQAIKTILPALGNEFISLLKESAIVSVIGVGELMFQTSVIQGSSFKPFLPLVITSLIYFVLTLILSLLLRYFEKKMKVGKANNEVFD
ncbi:amino acid ABC transporter, permease protein [Lapidilactobacillus concavus DSM 17758]|uniref:Amino acid ABC transporter, permease protein n=1 Tax=Lapidilactobacillus concavus DSM 17758 TaxID=1423735 RepID=A0A0R1W7N5_9LACO|nr:amino acid ABC transporter, permease protein [Lapidilactobacillus concavus DSM 17758]